MNTKKFDLLSMEELERLVKNRGEAAESAMRQLIKRENRYFNRSPIARPIQLTDYGINK